MAFDDEGFEIHVPAPARREVVPEEWPTEAPAEPVEVPELEPANG
jgi:hypothetical protein